jgi:DNA polymerase
MRGFFDREQGKSKTRPSTDKSYSCASCGLYKNSQTYKMEPYGNFKKGIINLGEAPGASEDEKGKTWQGKAGRALRRAYRQFGIDLFDDCLNINAVNCRPKANANPTDHQIACCRNVMVDQILWKYQPKMIMLFGGPAVKSFLQHRISGNVGGINLWRGWNIPDADYKTWVCPMYHPSFVLRSEDEVSTIFMDDLERAFGKLDQKLPRYKKPDIEMVDDLSFLYDMKSDLTSLDYETTGLKPHARGHRIICGSVSPNPDKAYVFMMPNTKKKMRPFLDYLNNQDIGKMAHNMKYERTWSRNILNTDIKHLVFDSMLGAHILDNRSGVAGLKFQTYVRLGVADYASEIEPFIKVENASGNDFNNILDLAKTQEGRKKLMTYCGYDTIYEYRIAKQMMEEMDYDFINTIY